MSGARRRSWLAPLGVALLAVFGSLAPSAGAGLRAGSITTPTPTNSNCSDPVRTVSAADGNTTITLQVGECFVFEATLPYNWTLMAADPTVVSCDPGQFGADQEGGCTAVSSGSTTITAVGSPGCLPLCGLPSRAVQLSVVVQ